MLNDEDRVRNLQAIYGYYADRRMWDDVVDLFAEDAVVEIGRQGVWRGKAGVRRWLDGIGEQGLRHGQLNDRVQFNVTVKVAPGGNEAYARGIELGMLGEADREQGWWEITTFHNRFVRQDGVWKLQEMRRFVQAKTDIFLGWGKSRISDPVPVGATAPDRPDVQASPAALVPAFLGRHPVTGRLVQAKGRAKLVATGPLTGRIAAGKDAPVDSDEIRRRLDRSRAWDGAMNVGAAYGFYLDDSRPAGFAGLIAEKGFKVTPAIGYYIGRDRILAARAPSAEPEKRPGISYHWLVQPVFLISDDGRSATGHVRLFNFRTGKTVGKAGDLFGASFWGGMYYNQYVLENGHWRIWDLTIEEPFIRSLAWKDGLWAKVKDPVPPRPGNAAAAASNPFPPDIPIKALGKRAEGFRGGTGQTIEWPSIMPMWFEFTNPVSGRVPPLHQTDCTPCLVRPDLRLDRNGYQRPPDAPAANRSP
nr:nuclear transport factor 2 family protein [Sphingobium lignivorans]